MCVFLCDSAVTRMIEEGAVKTVRGREEQKREGGPPLRSLGHSHMMSESGLEGGHPKGNNCTNKSCECYIDMGGSKKIVVDVICDCPPYDVTSHFD